MNPLDPTTTNPLAPSTGPGSPTDNLATRTTHTFRTTRQDRLPLRVHPLEPDALSSSLSQRTIYRRNS